MSKKLDKVKNAIENHKRKREFQKDRKANSPYYYYWDKVNDIERAVRNGADYAFGWFIGTALLGVGGVTASILLNAQIDEIFGEGMFKNFILANSVVMFTGYPF